ncbi:MULTISPECIES: signal peptidase II [Moraxella]|uniref:signal peptidase II n=1 Tax=Moraxella TaxID=475 RepID=UPI0009F1A247|nr:MULTISPECIES: signal peptidase II [Moraxella]MBE9579419.1 lipoprotein signal peptidase [Moraxella sp. K1664]MBE9588766.1 lipoprotein signal peptidase [Moraxella sp. K1630]MBE9591268.1 lipoprotein signal peptidase [Moraxella sp. K127]MBE9596977.1 lipoprotein signal peptidase [Moraxella sp. K2450]MDH9219519.1 signal peptidase II [Moraxella lacunata]
MSENTQNSTTPPIQPNANKATLYYLIGLVVLILDQATKIFFEKWLVVEGNSVSVIEPILNWTLAYNRGAAFSFLANQGGWQKWFFAVLGLLVSAFIMVYLRKIPKNAKILAWGLALVLGGAIGNVIDRFLYGHVIDFIHVHYANMWHYPVFNVADMAIMGGMGLVMVDMLFLENKRKNGVS